jgi:hypothetical protein
MNQQKTLFHSARHLGAKVHARASSFPRVLKDSRESSVVNFPRKSRWIPAFAGMTGFGSAGIETHSRGMKVAQ